MPMKAPPGQRDDYRWFLPLATRWRDNDVFGHVNNVVYYSYFDTLANQFLIDEGGFDFARGPAVGFVVESGCRYHAPIAHPSALTGGLRVAHLGRSSVRYEMAIFTTSAEAAAEGHFTHVFVDRDSQQPTPIPQSVRTALEEIQA